MNDEQQIRQLIEGWATAVHAGDLDTVLADHSDDIVMFDVPPPYEGVRGRDAYSASWPPFFEWQASGAVFEITALEITAGTDVAFAYALLRCGTPEQLASDPGYRLRLTLGLVKRDGRWTVQHEHHSFPEVNRSQQSVEEVRQVHRDWAGNTASNDLDEMMVHIADDVVSYEHAGPLEYRGVAAVRGVCERGLAAGRPGIEWTIPDLRVLARDDLAVTWGLDHLNGRTADGETFDDDSRATRVFQRQDGRWKLIHQHLSYPR